MKISLPLGIIRKAKGTDFDLLSKRYSPGSYSFKRMIEDKQYPNTDKIQLNLSDFTGDELTTLWKFAMANDADSRTLSKIELWTSSIKNPHNSVVQTLQAMKGMMDTLMKDNEYKWLMRLEDDGYYCPYLVTSFKYEPPRRDERAYFVISLMRGFYFDWEEHNEYSAEEEKTKTVTDKIYFYFESLFGKGTSSDTVSDYDMLYDTSTLDDSNDDYDEDEDTPKKRKTKKNTTKESGRQRLKLLDVLASKNLFIPTEKSLSTFFAASKKCYEIAPLLGKQFVSSSKGFILQKSWWGGSRKEIKPIHMQEDETPFRLVIDMKGIPSELERQEGTTYAGNQLIPYHPYIRMYNLTKYAPCSVHADSLSEYQYNKNILDNVVLSEELKNYLNSIMGGKDNFVDVIEGKSGGMIILGSGKPGIGKTLTAEAWSEKMERPLYQINASQLGVKIKNIEGNLYDCLRRAERWAAVLLIDEADTYVYKRGKKILQNCIVGVFLKLLEYFNGVMFLTTNKHDIIDEAILSRCTAHIRYELPNEEQRAKILLVHSKLQGINLSEAEAKKIAKQYEMSGRDIRNMLKNVKKFYHKQEKLTLKAEMIKPVEAYIPFLDVKTVK